MAVGFLLGDHLDPIGRNICMGTKTEQKDSSGKSDVDRKQRKPTEQTWQVQTVGGDETEQGEAR